MTVPNAPSSDQALASALSRKLRGPVKHDPPEPPKNAYVQMPRLGVRQTARYAGAPPPVPDVDMSDGLGAELWEKLLPWCMSVSGTTGAFVMDRHGLVVAQAGALPVDDIEAIGARLVLTMEQVDLMDGLGASGGSMCIEVGDRCVSTVRVSLDQESWLLVALLGADQLPRTTRSLVMRSLTETLRS